jgi:hypothetical protein
VLFFPPLLLYAFIFAVYYCFIPILFFSGVLRFTVSRLPFIQRTYLTGILAMLSVLFIAIRFGVSERGSSEVFGPSGLTYLMLAQGLLVSLVVWRIFSRVFWPNDKELEIPKANTPEATASFKRKYSGY